MTIKDIVCLLIENEICELKTIVKFSLDTPAWEGIDSKKIIVNTNQEGKEYNAALRKLCNTKDIINVSIYIDTE